MAATDNLSLAERPYSPNWLFSASRGAVDTGRTVRRIGLDGAADRKGNFLNDIASDEARKLACIPDGGLHSALETKAGIIVVDFAAGSAGNDLQASTLKDGETGEPFHVQQAAQRTRENIPNYPFDIAG